MAHDKQNRDAILKRLSRLNGQVQGVSRMVEDGRYCALWPSARQWQCHRVEPAGPGSDLVFIAKDGHRTAARYSHAP